MPQMREMTLLNYVFVDAPMNLHHSLLSSLFRMKQSNLIVYFPIIFGSESLIGVQCSQDPVIDKLKWRTYFWFLSCSPAAVQAILAFSLFFSPLFPLNYSVWTLTTHLTTDSPKSLLLNEQHDFFFPF